MRVLPGSVGEVAGAGEVERDAEVVDAARAAGVTMYFTGTRHFAH